MWALLFSSALLLRTVLTHYLSSSSRSLVLFVIFKLINHARQHLKHSKNSFLLLCSQHTSNHTLLIFSLLENFVASATLVFLCESHTVIFFSFFSVQTISWLFTSPLTIILRENVIKSQISLRLIFHNLFIALPNLFCFFCFSQLRKIIIITWKSRNTSTGRVEKMSLYNFLMCCIK